MEEKAFVDKHITWLYTCKYNYDETKVRQVMIKILKNLEEVGLEAARILARQLILKPNSAVALPTGSTPLKMYEAFANFARSKIVELKDVHFFNLDEYIGLTKSDSLSYAYYMRANLFSKIAKVDHRIPKTNALDPEKEALDYEKTIRSAGGFDLCFLGIGVDGHIGFNEPGTSFSSVTHVANLHSSTIERNTKQIGKSIPRKAITVGIKTIMNSRRIVLMAVGIEKTKVISQALLDDITPKLPASVLQLHPNLTILLDEEAAQKINSSANGFHLINL